MRLRDRSLLVDHVRDALRILRRRGVRGAVREADGTVRVAEQREVEFEFFREGAVLGGSVEADAEDLGVAGVVLAVEVPEPGTFPRSAGCVGLRIEPEHDLPAAIVGKLHGVAAVIEHVEVGCGFARLQHVVYCSDVSLEEWNERYRTREEIDDHPAPLLVDAAKGLAPGCALDLACGAGRNAIWLARNGWNATAIDGAEEAIRIVHEHDSSIDARVLDLETGAPLPFDDQTFDLVAILYYLHRPLFAEALRVVKRGGIIVAAARMRGRYRVDPGELAQHFAGCKVLRSNEDGEIAEIVVRR